MEDNVIDEKTKTFLIACLVTGIDVVADDREFMIGLVEHLNLGERSCWSEGDEDGVIVHDKFGNPFLMLMYDGIRLTFKTIGYDEFTAMSVNADIAFSLIHVIDYIRSLELQFCPSILGSEASTVLPSDDTSDTNPEDWAM